jgi:uncharacterized protein (TIGR02300 family)
MLGRHGDEGSARNRENDGGLAFDSGHFAWQGSRPSRIALKSQQVFSLANPELGAKQICPTCTSKFYDLGRRPATCPKCGTQFDPEEAIRNRRVRARSSPADYEETEEQAPPPVAESDGFEEEVDETPEVDEAAAEPIEVADEEEAPEGGITPAAEDLGVDFAEEEEDLEEEAADIPFLEDEDEDDNFEDEIEGLPEEEPD